MAACEAGAETMSCITDKGTRIGIDIVEAIACAYFAVTCVLLCRKINLFKQMPYAAVKKGIVYFTLQVLQRFLRLMVSPHSTLPPDGPDCCKRAVDCSCDAAAQGPLTTVCICVRC